MEILPYHCMRGILFRDVSVASNIAPFTDQSGGSTNNEAFSMACIGMAPSPQVGVT